VVVQLLAHRLVLLEHDLLVLAHLPQFLLGLGGRFVKDFLEVDPSFFAPLQVSLGGLFIFIDVREEKQLLREGLYSVLQLDFLELFAVGISQSRLEEVSR